MVKLLDIVVLVFLVQEPGDISEEINSAIISKFGLIRSSVASLFSLGVLYSGKTGGTGSAKPVVPVFLDIHKLVFTYSYCACVVACIISLLV